MEKIGRELRGVDMQAVLDSCATHAAGTEFARTPRCMRGDEIETELSALRVDLDDGTDVAWLLALTEDQIRERVIAAYVVGARGLRRRIFRLLFDRGWYGMAEKAAKLLIVPDPVPTDDTLFSDPRVKGRPETLPLQAIVFNLQEIRLWLRRRLEAIKE